MNTTKHILIFAVKAHAGVMQDKKPPWRFSASLAQSSTATLEREAAPSQFTTQPDAAVNRQKHHGSETRQLALIAGRVSPQIKTQVLRRAHLKGWSESKTVADLVEMALAHDLAESFSMTLKNALSDTLETEMQKERKENNRAANFALEAFYSAEMGRVITISILRLLVGDDTEILEQIIQQAREQAQEALQSYSYKDITEEEAQNHQWQS